MPPRADRDRIAIYEWLAIRSSPETANTFVKQLLAECDSLAVAPARGTVRDVGGRQVRAIGFRRTVTIVFTVLGEAVVILRLLYRGKDFVSERLG